MKKKTPIARKAGFYEDTDGNIVCGVCGSREHTQFGFDGFDCDRCGLKTTTFYENENIKKGLKKWHENLPKHKRI